MEIVDDDHCFYKVRIMATHSLVKVCYIFRQIFYPIYIPVGIQKIDLVLFLKMSIITPEYSGISCNC